MSRTFVVAEPGCVHEGKLDTMLRLIDVAHAAGADAFKNQYLGNPDEVRRRRKSEYPSYDWLNYPLEWHAICREKCNSLGMQYGCSTNLAEDLVKVAPYVQFHKRPSFENNDREWLDAAKASGQRFMVSSGMLDHDGLWRLQDEVDRRGAILHCVSNYDPAPMSSLQLGVIRQYDLDGFSDHSASIDTGLLAVLAGARIVEVHMRLETQQRWHRLPIVRDRVHRTSRRNPDYAVALSPRQLQRYVRATRAGAWLMGTGEKHIQPCEAAMLPYRVNA